LNRIVEVLNRNQEVLNLIIALVKRISGLLLKRHPPKALNNPPEGHAFPLFIFSFSRLVL
jgi:hypothetical protein